MFTIVETWKSPKSGLELYSITKDVLKWSVKLYVHSSSLSAVLLQSVWEPEPPQASLQL